MLRRVLIAACLLAPGCADPASSELRVGDRVVAYSKKEREVVSLVVDGRSKIEHIAVGSPLVVNGLGDGEGSLQVVRVILQSGEDAGKVAELPRYALRPAR